MVNVVHNNNNNNNNNQIIEHAYFNHLYDSHVSGNNIIGIPFFIYKILVPKGINVEVIKAFQDFDHFL